MKGFCYSYFFPFLTGILFDHTSVLSRENYNGKCMNFRQTLYPASKAHHSLTPDGVIQGIQFLKASIKAMSIQVTEVPGVEAGDVIGTLPLDSRKVLALVKEDF
ncbi:uncharacterized protein LOC113278219 [Papaver somniferum]|uniref:uncharacterized protein LOC113278219 n=1 Tax=Papaver somniferum TaxID=3469 RepID=UPI000E6F614B|nr:uncharacterized protein LOC113278219 [Papaver somniferum]XP_026382904.1 uncharacterized protein LOC113278219 [Papaver somniferum]